MPATPDAPGSACRDVGSHDGDVDFVGVDDESPANKCPAILVVPGTGDLLQVGRRVTDPATLAQLARHTSIADDEVAIWTPANLKQGLLDALTGAYDQGQTGPGEPTFEQRRPG